MGLMLKGILKKAEVTEKNIHEQKAEFVYFCVIEKKKNRFEISVIILRYIRNENLSYSKRILKLQNFLQKTYLFFFTSEGILKMVKETKKGDSERICGRVTKSA